MAQKTILAAGNAAAESTSITLGGGESTLLGLFTPVEGAIAQGVHCYVLQQTPGQPLTVNVLNAAQRTARIEGPGTFTVTRPDFEGTALGIFTDDGASRRAYDSVDDMYKIKSVQKKFRDSFMDPALAKWDVSTVGDMAATVSSGALAINMGTTADTSIVLTSKEFFTIPCRALVGWMLSQRIVGQTTWIELVSCDEAGVVDGQNVMAWRVDGTSATAGYYETANSGGQRLMSASNTIPTTASMNILELEPFADEAWWHGRAIDSSNARANSYIRHQQIPDPSRLYKLRIRLENRQWFNLTTGVTSGSPKVRIAATAHGMSTGNQVEVANINLGAGLVISGVYTVTVIDANSFELDGTTFAGAFVNDGYARWARVGLAPASATTATFQFASCIDYAELTAEITAGRGQAVAGQALGVNMLGTAAVSAAGNAAVAVESMAGLYAALSSTALAAGASYTGSVLSAFSATYANMKTAYLLVSVLHNAGTTGAHGTLTVETYDTTSTTTPSSNQRLTYSVPVPSDGLVHTYLFPIPTKYFRVGFKNNASVTQTAFNLSYATRYAGGGEHDIERNIPFLLSTTALGVSATFTGTAFDFGASRLYRSISVVASPDQAGTLALEQSYDGTTWLRTHSQAVAANEVALLLDAPILMRYARVVFINGGVAQTTFRLHATVNS